MGKVVVLEGPDGGGKTTLAKFLCTEADFDYKHEGPPPPGRDQIEYYKIVLYKALEADHNTVFDRLFLGEHIYGPIARGHDGLTIDGLKLFERIIASKPVWQYICMPHEERIRKNYLLKLKDPSDYLKDEKKLDKIIAGYYRMMLRPFNHVFDYEHDSPQEVLRTVTESDFVGLPAGLIGSPDAKVLFVADVPNHPTVDWPFFALNNSSGYFNKALELAGLREDDIALGNAFGPSGERHDSFKMVRSLPKLKRIILMGGKAQEWYTSKVSAVHIPIGFVHHPSYMKRFVNTDPQVLANEIRRKIWQS